MTYLLFILCSALLSQELSSAMASNTTKEASSTKTLNVPRNLGCYGETFPIAETNLLTFIMEKLKKMEASGDLTRHQDIIRKRVAHTVTNPEPVAGVHHTVTPRTFTYDPTFVLQEDIRGHEGQVLYKAGTSFNPLKDSSPFLLIKQLTLTDPLLFADGDVHVPWIQKQLKQHPQAKVILVKGSPFTCSGTLHHPVYFDQGGFLCQRLRLTQVPAKVTQENDHLLIEELQLEEFQLGEVTSW